MIEEKTMKNIENKIKTVLSDELELPLNYKQMIRNTLYTEKNKKVFQRFNFFNIKTII